MALPGALYDPTNVVVGQAVLYVAPSFTAMPADASVLFDPSNWTGKVLTAAGATAITLQVVTAAGTQTTASLTSFATITAAAVQAALTGLSNVGAGKASVSGINGGPFTINFDASLGAVTLSISASTGGTPTISGGLWLPAGASEQGWSFGGNVNTNDITIEEQSTPVGVQVQSRQVSVSGTMAEDVMQSWQWSFNATKTVTAAASGITGKTELNLSDNLTHYAVALEMVNKYGMARRLYIPDNVSIESATVVARRAQMQRLLPVSFRSVCATNLIRIQEITAAALP